MLLLVFELGGEVTLVRIMGNNILFSNSATHFQQFAPIDGLGLSKAGIIKQFPDLEGLPDAEMRKEAVRRFKEHVKTLGGETEVKEYVVKELGQYGWKLKSSQRDGFRRKIE